MRGLLLVVALLGAGVTACTDGTPSFRTPLRTNADLDALTVALESGDLEVASAEARRLTDLADEAPSEIRTDLRALGDAVVQIVDLLADETSGTGDASEIERRRDRLNDDLAELDLRSERVSTWALQECGLQLD